MKRFLLPLLLLTATLAQAEGNNLIGDNVSMETTGTGYGKAAVVTNAAEPIEFYTNKTLRGSISGTGVFSFGGLNLPNNTYLTATDAAGTGTISMLKADATDDTVLNAKSGELIKLSENGTAGVTLDPSTNGFTFASLATFGSNSTTDAITAMRLSDGTAKGLIYYSSNELRLYTITNHGMTFGINSSPEAALSATALYPYATGGSALGTTSYGWNGLYLSDGTDKWSLVPGVNLLTLAAGTSDGADDQRLTIAGGGVGSNTQGGFIMLDGADKGGAGAGGDVIIGAADVGDIMLRTTSTGDVIVQTGGSTTRWTFEDGGNLTQDATNGGNIVMAKAGTGFRYGLLDAAISNSAGVPPVHVMDDGGWLLTTLQASANTTPGGWSFYKSRAATLADGTAGQAVANNDNIGILRFYGADGANFQQAAQILVSVDGTPGAADMPGRMLFYVSPDGSATPAEAMRISQDKSVTIAAGIKSSATDVGWVVRAGGDTACTTTCGANKGCLFGIDAGASAVVACATATADTCLCSQ